MKIILARHAETTENIKGIDSGSYTEPTLTEKGIEQAKKLAEFLKQEKIHFAYLSPQKRALHTAGEVLRFHPSAKVTHAHHLKEQNLGAYEGLPKDQWKKIKSESKELFHLFKPPEGESYAELQQRVKTFFGELFKKHKDDNIFIVSHAGTLGMLYLHIFNKEITEENYKTHRPENTAVTILEIYEDSPIKIHKINSTEHLLS